MYITQEFKYIKKSINRPKREIDGNTVTVEDFNTLLTSLNRSSRESLTIKQF